MRIDWNNKDSFKRLLAAMVAAQDMKLNYAKIASMYGQGATYDSIEGHFRKIKKEAVQLREEHGNEAAGAPSSSTPVAKTSRKQKRKLPSKNGKAGTGPAVLSGRVKKSSAAKCGKAIKEEVVGDEGGKAIKEEVVGDEGGKAIKEEVVGDEDENAAGETDAEMEIVGSQLGLSADTTSLYTTDDMWSGGDFSQDFRI